MISIATSSLRFTFFNHFFNHFHFQLQFGRFLKKLTLLRFTTAAISRVCDDYYQKDYDFRPNCQTYQWLLDGWLNSGFGSLFDCQRVHGLVLKSGFGEDDELGRRMFEFYVVHGRLRDARQLLDEMLERGVGVSVVLWNMLLSGFAVEKLSMETIKLLSLMVRENVVFDVFTLANALRAFGGDVGGSAGLRRVQQIHAKAIVYGLSGNRFVCNPLIDLYSKAGLIDCAKCVFDHLRDRDNVSWVAMMSGFSKNGRAEQSIVLFCNEMLTHGVTPTPYALSSVLSACSKMEWFVLGQELHGLVFKWGFASELFVCNALVSLYSRGQDFKSASKIFEKMKRKDAVSYNSLISGLAQQGFGNQALALLQKMQHDFLKPNCVTVASLVSGCATIGALDKGRQLHSYALKSGFLSDMLVEGSLLDLYVKCSDIETAREYFMSTKRDNVDLWNVMLVAYGQVSDIREASRIFSQMQFEGLEPNQYTYPSVLRTCTSVGAMDLGEQIHTQLIKTGFQSNEYVCSVLIDMYSTYGFLKTAEKIFRRLSENDVVSWTAMIAGYVRHKMFVNALELFEEMLNCGIQADNIELSSAITACAGTQALNQGRQIHAQSCVLGYSYDISIGKALVSLYARCGRVQDACQVFKRIDVKDNMPWNALITGFSQTGRTEEALRVFTEMNKAGIEANMITYSSSISAAANTANVKQGKQIQAKMFKTGYNLQTESSNALITLYAKCGWINDAKRVFSEAGERNEVTWNAMITGYSQHGCGREALDTYKEMKSVGLTPDHVTFIGILSACSHVGLVEEGLSHFESMSQDYGLVPKLEHYVCVVDLLGRAGFLDRAKRFIEEMPLKPDARIWRTLLSACTIHKNKEIGEFAAHHLLESEPDDSATYALICNMHGVTKNFTGRDNYWKMRKERGVKKEPGRSWIEVKNLIHAFYAGDNLHPMSDTIYKFLGELNERVAEIGYVQDVYGLPVDKENRLVNVHSERLAIAFGLLTLPSSIPLLVMKNLRVCTDCHNWINCVSKISNRTIVVRDAYRFHHFESGSCSCKGYW